jgi:hypothetical protein
VDAPDVPVVVRVNAPCLLLKVDQSVGVNTPRLVADALGTFNVITGVVVPLATEEDKSVPDVPKVSAATDITVPPVNIVAQVLSPRKYVLAEGVPVADKLDIPTIPDAKDVVIAVVPEPVIAPDKDID